MAVPSCALGAWEQLDVAVFRPQKWEIMANNTHFFGCMHFSHFSGSFSALFWLVFGPFSTVLAPKFVVLCGKLVVRGSGVVSFESEAQNWLESAVNSPNRLHHSLTLTAPVIESVLAPREKLEEEEEEVVVGFSLCK